MSQAVAVLGAGNGGQALAALLQHAGYRVRLWNRGEAQVQALLARDRVIEVHGAAEFRSQISHIGSDLLACVEGANLVFLVLPAVAHRELGRRLAGYLPSNTLVILVPGRTAGAREFAYNNWGNDVRFQPTVLETQSLFCACRAGSAGIVEILSFKSENLLSGISPTGRARVGREALASLPTTLAPMRWATSTLQTGLENMGAILHPAPVLLNTGWIESRDVFFPHYYYGISRSVARFVERLDEERCELASRFGLTVRTVGQWHLEMYGHGGQDLYETLHVNTAYASIDAPRSLSHRYIHEDVSTGLVPMVELGRVVGLPMPRSHLVVDLACELTGVDYWECGRTLDRLGIRSRDATEVASCF